jgi:hypothetical protein
MLGQLHFASYLIPGEEPAVPVEYETVWARESVWEDTKFGSVGNRTTLP